MTITIPIVKAVTISHSILTLRPAPARLIVYRPLGNPDPFFGSLSARSGPICDSKHDSGTTAES